MFDFFSKFVKKRRRRSSKVVISCIPENEPEGKMNNCSQENSDGIIEGYNNNNSNPNSNNNSPNDRSNNYRQTSLDDNLLYSQTIRRDLTKSLSYDLHDTQKIDDIYIGKPRPVISSHYEPDNFEDETYIIEEQDNSSDVLEKYQPSNIREPIQFQLNQIHNIKHISDGTKSTIFQAQINNTGRVSDVILKTIRIDDTDVLNTVKDFNYEKDLLSSLCHSNIVQLLGYTFDHTCSDGIHRPVLIFEKLTGGSLSDLLNNRTLLSKYPIPFLKSLQILRDLSSAIKYLHCDYHNDITIIHRDLKPDNICFTASGDLKLIDFGLCTTVKRSESCLGLYVLTGHTGTMRYMAPEVMCSEPYSEKVDIYSLSIIIWQVLTGMLPYATCDRSDHKYRICELHERPDISLIKNRTNNENILYQLTRIIQSCWNTNPRERFNIVDVYHDLSILFVLQNRLESSNRKAKKYQNNSQNWIQRSNSCL